MDLFFVFCFFLEYSVCPNIAWIFTHPWGKEIGTHMSKFTENLANLAEWKIGVKNGLL